LRTLFNPRSLVQRSVAQLPWRHNIALLEKLKDPPARLWYAQQAIAPRQAVANSVSDRFWG